MLQILLYILILGVVFTLIMYVAYRTLWSIMQLINISNNPYRIYHIIAFFGIILMCVFIVVKYFEILIKLAKLID